MKKHRVFIAVNLPPEVKKRLFGFREKWMDLPVRWTKEDNLHITLLFLDYLDDDEAAKVCVAAREIAANYRSFPVSLSVIGYNTRDGKETPKMVWVSGEKSGELAKLRDDLLEKISDLGLLPRKETRPFNIHITLGRIIQSGWRLLETEPKIEEKINIKFNVESVEVMESGLIKKGREYIVLESVRLK